MLGEGVPRAFLIIKEEEESQMPLKLYTILHSYNLSEDFFSNDHLFS